MVLQQNTTVRLWGKADARKSVILVTSWDGKTTRVRSSATGDWLASVPTPAAGGPYTITISDGEAVTLSNILIGEVWLCTGQSNMEMPVKGFTGQPVDGALDALAAARPADNLRILTVQHSHSRTPSADCATGSWQESTPASVAGCSAAGYFFARQLQEALHVPVGLICTTWGGSNIQAWMSREALSAFPEVDLNLPAPGSAGAKNPNVTPTVLYNAMIHPLRYYTVRGAIWYQGEANRNQPALYKKLFPAMVQSWRELWQQGDFPFYYVQIAPHCYGRDNGDKTNAADLRQVQFECLQLIPNSGMAVTADIGNPTCIHPAKKKEVGQRLALWALAKTYGREGLPYSGPVYRQAEVKGNQVTVDFDYADNGLTSYDQPVAGFELAGADSVFYAADAAIAGRNRLRVTAAPVAQPRYIRFAYKNYQPVNLYNTYRLPAVPFRAELP